MTPQQKSIEIYDLMKGFRVKNSHRKKCAILHVMGILNVISGLEDSVWAANMKSFFKQTQEELQKIKP